MTDKKIRWQQKDGSSIAVKSMTDAHLTNAVRRFERKFSWEIAVLNTRCDFENRLVQLLDWMDELRGLAAEHTIDGY